MKYTTLITPIIDKLLRLLIASILGFFISKGIVTSGLADSLSANAAQFIPEVSIFLLAIAWDIYAKVAATSFIKRIENLSGQLSTGTPNATTLAVVEHATTSAGITPTSGQAPAPLTASAPLIAFLLIVGLPACATSPGVVSETATPLPPTVSFAASAATSALVNKYPEAAPVLVVFSQALESAAVAGKEAPTPAALATTLAAWTKTLPALSKYSAAFQKTYAAKIYPDIQGAENGAPALTQVAEVVRQSAATSEAP